MKTSLTKLSVGLILLGVVVITWGPFLINYTTTMAVVNAEIVRFSAPFQGIAAPELPPPGIRLRINSEIPLLEAAVPEERELDRLVLDLETARSRIVRLEETLATLDRHEMDVRDRWQSLVETGREVLTRLREEGEAMQAAALARRRQAEVDLALAEDMQRRGLFANTRVEAARRALAAAQAEADVARARVATIEARMRALERGVHFTDGYNDVPYNVQQLDRLLLLREQILDRLTEERAREKVLARAVAAERRAVELRSRYTQRLDRNLVVWARHAAPGSIVGPGAPLLDLIDCDRLFVDALLPDRVYPNILGAQPRIRLAGGLTLRGEIAQIRGSGAKDSTSMTAARPTADAVERLIVRISLPAGHSPLLEGQGGNLCGVGRQAEIVIPGALTRAFDTLVSTIRHMYIKSLSYLTQNRSIIL